jgi:hypothetical protein
MDDDEARWHEDQIARNTRSANRAVIGAAAVLFFGMIAVIVMAWLGI